MVSGSTKRKKKKASAAAAGAAGAGASQSQPQSQQRQRSDLDTTSAAAAAAAQEEEEETVELDAEGQEILALAQALGEEAHAPTDVEEGSVTAGLARRLAERGVRLVVTPDKGRVCLAAGGFEPGRVVLEERAYVHGSGTPAGAAAATCLECDDDPSTNNHSPHACPRVQAAHYPMDVVPRLSTLEGWMAERLGRVQTLDRARAWLKAIVRMHPPTTESLFMLTSEWAAPLLPLTVCNLDACVRDAQLLAQRHPSLFPHGPDSLALAARLLGALNTNSHELEELGPGSGLFLLASLCEHSCLPNCTFSTYGTTLRLTTLRPIQKDEPLSIDYAHLFYAPGTDRRAALQATYGFTCHCPLCTGGPNEVQQQQQEEQQQWTTPDRARAFTCPVEDCDGPVCPFGVEGRYWTCLSCGRGAHPLEVKAYQAAESAVLAADPIGLRAADAVLRATPLHHTHYAVFGAIEAAARALSAQSATAEPAAAPLAAQAWDRALSVLNEGLSHLYPPPAARASGFLRGGGGDGGGGNKSSEGGGGGGFGYAHHPEIPALLDRVAQARVLAGDIRGAKHAWRDAYQAASLITGADWIPTIDLARLSIDPPTTRKGVLSYYTRRPHLLRQLERAIRGSPSPTITIKPFPGPYPEGYTSVVSPGGGERQAKRWAALRGRLGGEGTRRALDEEGMVVLDDALGPAWSQALRAEIEHLVRLGGGCMKPNQTRFGPTEVYTKPFISEADLHDPQLRSRVPALAALLEREDLTEALKMALPPSMGLRGGMNGRALKVQRNGGGGACFPWHYDNPGRPNKRRLTCLVYLNPDWREGDGGELVLAPFLGAKPTVIPPLMDRMVIFRSDAMLHRVLPAHRERYCLTVWLDGAEGTVNGDEDVQLRLSPQEATDPAALAARLRLHPSQRVLSRPVYAEEYEASLRECMVEGTPGAAQMLAAHAAHLAAVEKSPPLARLVELLRVLKAEREGDGKEEGPA